MISLVVLGVLGALGAPSFFEWLQTSQTRAAAEAVLNGIQSARAEAIQRNKNVRVKFTPPGTSWNVYEDATSTLIQTRTKKEGTLNAVLTPTPAAGNTITFGPLGSVVTNSDTSATITQLDVTNSKFAGARAMRIMITGGGSVRMCDPNASITVTDPRHC
jgi:type IV fimbrial biogenesis protein FimT